LSNNQPVRNPDNRTAGPNDRLAEEHRHAECKTDC
jgi:hypothetical protein